ncbi:MAG: hypothetical protein J5I91_01820 [Bacteroidetes bacterium]|nr:hypothetical protein [Bacteroidota bacterium]
MKNLLNLICLGALTILLSTSMISKTSMQNIPKDHETAGVLYPPIDVPEPINTPLWQVINNTGCEISVNLWVSIAGGEHKSYTVPVNANSTQIITSGNLNLPSGVNIITKASANVGVSYNGSPYSSFEVYPVTNSGNKYTSLPPPCDCVQVVFSGNTITISYC